MARNSSQRRSADTRRNCALRKNRWGKQRRMALALGLVSGLPFTGIAQAQTLPQGGVVVGGAGTIQQTAPNQLTINQATQNLAINWNSFSVGAADIVRFVQPSTSSVALNRVLNGDPSQIYGQIQANGQVVIMSPNGIVFGPNSRVDVNALVATTANIATADFMAGKLLFDQASSDANARVVNKGVISVAQGGFAVLAAAGVSNEGRILATGGTVVLGGTKTFAIDFHGDGLLKFAATGTVDQKPAGADALVENAGSIEANGGRVLMTARAARSVLDNVINTTGIVVAHSAQLVNGEIVIDGGDAGIVSVDGTLDASGAASGERGGTVKVLGEKVGLFAAARIDASGDAGGGTVLVGGNYQGKGPEANAQYLYMDARAVIDASSVSGNGGRVILWSDLATRNAGHINVSGGRDGGFVEVSSKGYLDFRGTVNLRGLSGRAGELLLDPTDITITNAASSGGMSAGSPFAGTNATSNLDVAVLNAALAGGDVTVTTASAGAGRGNIDITATIANSVGGRTLTLRADGAITIGTGGYISSGGYLFNVSLRAGGNITVGGNGIVTSGGNIRTESVGGGGPAGGNFVSTANINAGSGNVTLAHAGSISIGIAGSLTTTGNGSIALDGRNTVTVDGSLATNVGTITIWGNAPGGMTTAGRAAGTAWGVKLNATASISSGVGAISIVGKGADGSGVGQHGIVFYNGGVVQSVSGAISLDGRGADGAAGGMGIAMLGGSIQSASGRVLLEGDGAVNSDGIQISRGANIHSGSGTLTLTGYGAGTGYGFRAQFDGSAPNPISKIGTAAGTGDIKIRAYSMSMSAISLLVQSKGVVSLLPLGEGTTIGIGGGAGTLQLPGDMSFVNADLLVVGDGDVSGGEITVGASGFSNNNGTDLDLRSASIALNGNVTLTGETLTLYAESAGVTQTAGSNISVDNLVLRGEGNFMIDRNGIGYNNIRNVAANVRAGLGSGAIVLRTGASGGSSSNTLTDGLGTVNGITTTGGLTWVALNGLSQTGAGLISVGGVTNLTAQNGTMDMSAAVNSFGAQVAASSAGGGAILLKAKSLALGTVTSDSNVTLIATNGGITQTGLLTASGNLNASANGGTLGLSSYQNIVGGSVSLATSGGANNLAWTQFGPMLVGSISSSSQLNLSVTNGGISQSGTIAAAGATTLSVDTGDIALTNAANAFVGAIAATNTVGGISLANTGNTLLGNILSNGVLNVSVTGGTLSQMSGSTFSATGNATIALAGAYALSLTESGNNIGGNLTLSGSTGTLDGTLGGTVTVTNGTFAINGVTIAVARTNIPTALGGGSGGTSVSSAISSVAPVEALVSTPAFAAATNQATSAALSSAVADLTSPGPAVGAVGETAEGASTAVVVVAPGGPAPAPSGAPAGGGQPTGAASVRTPTVAVSGGSAVSQTGDVRVTGGAPIGVSVVIPGLSFNPAPGVTGSNAVIRGPIN